MSTRSRVFDSTSRSSADKSFVPKCYKDLVQQRYCTIVITSLAHLSQPKRQGSPCTTGADKLAYIVPCTIPRLLYRLDIEAVDHSATIPRRGTIRTASVVESGPKYQA